MNDHPCWFVDDQEIVVFVDDHEGNRFGFHGSAGPRRDSRRDPLPHGGAVAGLFPPSVDEHAAGRDQCGSLIARKLEPLRDEQVEAGSLGGASNSNAPPPLVASPVPVIQLALALRFWSRRRVPHDPRAKE